MHSQLDAYLEQLRCERLVLEAMDKAPLLLRLCKLSALRKFVFVVFNVGRIP